MAHHLPALSPLWSFASCSRPDIHTPCVSAGVDGLNRPVQSWASGPDGRPRLRWTVGRDRFPDA